MPLKVPARVILTLAAVLAVPATAMGQQSKAIDPRNMDTGCAACSDFFRFANGGWLKRTKIPAAYPSYGAFYELYERNEKVLHDILESDAAKLRAGKLARDTPAWKVGAFYASCMDSAAIERAGASGIQRDLETIAAVNSRDDLVRALATLERRSGLAPWTDGSTQDARDAANTIAGLYQGGLSLPTKEYYTKADTASASIRDKFRAHVARMFTLLGDAPDRAGREAQTVLDFETRLARASKAPEDLRDPQANYHRMTLAELGTLTPHVSWPAFYRDVGAPEVQRVDVGQPAFFATVDTMVATVPLDDWKTLLRWRAVHSAAPSLSSAFVNENFQFDRTFSGATEQLARWRRCVSSTDRRLGELLGQEYVKRTFPPEAKARAVKIVDNLVREFRVRINAAAWMSAPTKQAALVKLDAFTRKIGYPDHWLDYSKVVVTPDNYMANVVSAGQWASQRDWAKIGKATVRTEWTMTPPTVNAYENPLLNEIVFPAGILQPPFFDPKADDGVNYGAMGAVIGHEMGHAFDDQGRQYDEAGNLRDWWTREDATLYTTEADKIVRQFNGYTVVDTATHVNGKLTLGENIGDFGGLTIAYSALERALEGKPRPKIDGFTPEQRFFLGWAQVWREVARPESMRFLVNSDPHAPSAWRVNGPLSNMPEFRAAWGCKDGDPMVRAAAMRPRIW